MPDGRYPIRDCPDHPQAALELGGGVICCGCGRAVVETALGPITAAPGPELVDELRRLWQSNLGVSAFVVEARAVALGMVEEATGP